MSVLIKGMEMPNNCGECQFCHTENFTEWCCPTGREDIFYDAIPEWCPLDEPKTGEWVEKGRNEDGTHNIVCDKCGAGYKTRGHARSINTKRKYRFCPQCGSRMVAKVVESHAD